MQKIAIYVLHPEESPRLAPWAVGRLDVDQKSAFMFFHDFLGAPNGMLMLNLMQTAGAQTDIIISLMPMTIEPQRLLFAVADYDFGLHGRIALVHKGVHHLFPPPLRGRDRVGGVHNI